MNENRFTGKAEIYKKYRPKYPKELFDYLYSRVGFGQDKIIADIGSGTGIFSRLLLERGSKVFCVEPNEDMRKTAESDLSGFGNFISVNGNDKNTGLHEKSVDFITAAQAFHWFDRQAFKLECRRILKDGGKVALIYNSRDDSSEMIRKLDIVKQKYYVDSQGFLQRGDPPEEYGDFFTDEICEYKTFRNDMKINKECFIGGNLSSSYAPREETDPGKYHGFVKDLDELFVEYNTDGFLDSPWITKSYTGRV